jgi:hypothetical protein
MMLKMPIYQIIGIAYEFCGTFAALSNYDTVPINDLILFNPKEDLD